MNCHDIKAKMMVKVIEIRDTVNFEALRLDLTGTGGIRDVAAALQRQKECERNIQK